MKSIVVFTTLIALIFASCEDKNGKRRSSNPDDPNGSFILVPSTTIVPVFVSSPEEFRLRGTHARLLRTEQGTRIHVPSDAFVSKLTGDPIDGDVVLTFNEYHTQGEILASGIPMKYINPTGDTTDFESAGVFDIRAFHEGGELELAPDKEIEVEFATEVDGTYEFYVFNESVENWELKSKENDPIPNPYIPKHKMELERLEEEMPETPKRLIEYEAGDPLFDVKRYGAQDQELDALDGVFWKFTGDSTQIDPSINNAAFNKKYDFIELKLVDSSEVREYDMFFRNETEEIVVRAAPIFQGKLLTRENDRMTRILNQIEYATRSKVQIEEELAQEKSLMRIIKVSEMGIYNYDREVNHKETVSFTAEFTFEGKSLNQEITVYLLPKEKNCVIEYEPISFDDFRINPLETNRLLVLSPKKKVVYFLSSEDLRNMNISKKTAGSTVVFDLKMYEKLVNDAVGIDELIATL